MIIKHLIYRDDGFERYYFCGFRVRNLLTTSWSLDRGEALLIDGKYLPHMLKELGLCWPDHEVKSEIGLMIKF